MMRFLLDMDGVTADFLTYWCQVFNHRYNRDVKPEDITTWAMHESIPGATKKQCENLIWEPGFFLHLKPMPGAVESITELWLAGQDIIFVTACGANGHEDKLTWLKRYFKDIDYHTIFTESKYMVKGDVFIDDRTKNLDAWRGEWRLSGGEAVCFDAPYNQDYNGERVRGWNELCEQYCVMQTS